MNVKNGEKITVIFIFRLTSTQSVLLGKIWIEWNVEFLVADKYDSFKDEISLKFKEDFSLGNHKYSNIFNIILYMDTNIVFIVHIYIFLILFIFQEIEKKIRKFEQLVLSTHVVKRN